MRSRNKVSNVLAMDKFGRTLDWERNKLISNLEKSNTVINESLISVRKEQEKHDIEIKSMLSKITELTANIEDIKYLSDHLISGINAINNLDSRLRIVELRIPEPI